MACSTAAGQEQFDGLPGNDDDQPARHNGPEPQEAVSTYVLQFGPVAGFTTGWNVIPEQAVFPLGSTVTFRVVAASDPVLSVWESGAISDPVLDSQFTLTLIEDQTVIATTPTGEVLSADLQCLPINPAMLSIGFTIEEEHPFLLDDSATNSETLDAYMRRDSLASIDKLDPDTYLTSVQKRLVFNSSGALRAIERRRMNRSFERIEPLDPDALGSLIEWRIDGAAVGVGDPVVAINGSGRHRVEVGPPGFTTTFDIVTYGVQISSSIGGDLIANQAPVVFMATTDPPGFEDRVRWLASTKHGSVYPVTGIGAVFTTTFDDTFRFINETEVFSWLGVKADATVRGQDQKNFANGLEIIDQAGESNARGARVFRITGWSSTQTGQGLDVPFAVSANEINGPATGGCMENLTGCRERRLCAFDFSILGNPPNFMVSKTHVECGGGIVTVGTNSIINCGSIELDSTRQLSGAPAGFDTVWTVVGSADVSITQNGLLSVNPGSSTGVVTVTRRSTRTSPTPEVITATCSIAVVTPAPVPQE